MLLSMVVGEANEALAAESDVTHDIKIIHPTNLCTISTLVIAVVDPLIANSIIGNSKARLNLH